MSPRLHDLSHELILQIVDLLLDKEKDSDTNDSENEKLAKLRSDNEAAEADGRFNRDSQEKDTQTDEATNDAFNNHSAQDSESQHKDGYQAFKVASSGEQNIINLSRICISFYKILSPYLFRSIILRNTRKSGAAVLYLCSTNQIKYVKTLHFKAIVPGERRRDVRDVEGVFPAEVKTVLSNLSQFPCLENMSIDFDFHLNTDNESEYCDDLFGNLTACDAEDTEEETERLEEQESLRALVKKTFEAICMDVSNGMRELVVKDWPMRANSIVGSNRFNKVCGIIRSIP